MSGARWRASCSICITEGAMTPRLVSVVTITCASKLASPQNKLMTEARLSAAQTIGGLSNYGICA
eukprot:1124958-Pleurochrysis_carterae.AAC.1